MDFEWDDEKDQNNVSKHGVDFDEAKTVFGDPVSQTRPDPDHSEQEDREITVGVSEKGRLLFVSHTEREDRIRIISARKATPQERKAHESGK